MYKGYYYDFEFGRFISAADIQYLDPKNINGLNLFTCCYNNPVMYLLRIDYNRTIILSF